MAIVGGAWLFSRYLLTFLHGWTADVSGYDPLTGGKSTEWCVQHRAGPPPPGRRRAAAASDATRARPSRLRGEKLCTMSGKFHLAWSVPMTDVSYWTPSAQIHSFLMFGADAERTSSRRHAHRCRRAASVGPPAAAAPRASRTDPPPAARRPRTSPHTRTRAVPFFIMKRNMIIQGIFLFAFGPLAAAFVTANLMEQASIWCFFSIAQIAVMLFLIREQLLIHWGRTDATKVSIMSKQNGTRTNGTAENGKAKAT